MGDPAIEASERDAVAADPFPAGLRGLLGRFERAAGSVAAASRERASHAAGGLRRPLPLRHGLAAWERGNHEAALALLREAVEGAPEDGEAVLALWDVARLCERPELAAPSLARWIRAEVSAGRREVAAGYWAELAERMPEEPVDAPTLVRLLPELRRRMADAPDEAARAEAGTALRRALRGAVRPDAPRLTPGLALRILEEARFLDAEVARRAGTLALAAPDLHASKRRAVEHVLARLDPARPGPDDEAAAPSTAPGERDLVGIQPLELAGGTLTVLESESGLRTRLDLRAIEAVAVARVGESGANPGLVIDLLLRPAPGAGRRRVFRMLSDAFDPGEVVSDRTGSDDPLRALLGALLDRSGAVPLPDPDSALGIAPPRFATLAEYEDAVLSRWSGRAGAAEVAATAAPARSADR